MQIREMNLKELYEIYEVLQELHVGVSYKEFEDLIYDMRHMEYKMFGLLESGKLITFAGAAVITNFQHKRHLCIFDLITAEKFRLQGYAKLMLEFLQDYAKTAMCENILLSCNSQENQKFYEKNGFSIDTTTFVKTLKHNTF